MRNWLVAVRLSRFATEKGVDHLRLCPSLVTAAEVSAALHLCHPDRSEPGFPATQH
jgi:hypothetical protein